MSINGKNINEIGVFLDSNLNFTIRVFTWGLANHLYIYKNYKKPIILSNLIQDIIQLQICERSHNAKVLQLDQQHEVPTFQDSLIYYEKLHEKIVRTSFIDVQNVKYISDNYFCPNSIKIEN